LADIENSRPSGFASGSRKKLTFSMMALTRSAVTVSGPNVAPAELVNAGITKATLLDQLPDEAQASVRLCPFASMHPGDGE
jgi:hypothetical protein